MEKNAKIFWTQELEVPAFHCNWLGALRKISENQSQENEENLS